MMTMDDAAALLSNLPDVTEGVRHGHRAWSVGGKTFAWERPFTKADLKRFGDETPPDGPLLAVSVADLNEKEAVLAANEPGIFTIAHFAHYPAVLIELDRVRTPALREALVDAWLTCAPAALASRYLAAQ